MPIERLVSGGFGVILLVLFALVGLVWNSSVQSTAASNSVDHTREVLAEFDGLRSEMEIAENGQWGYFLTKEKNFLSQRDSALLQFNTSLQNLIGLTKDNAQQQERLAMLQIAVGKRRALFLESQALFDSQGFAGSRPLFEAGHDAFAAARNMIIAGGQEEQSLLTQRKANEFSGTNFLEACLVFLFVSLAVLYVFIRRELGIRKSIEKALSMAREPLLKAGALQDAIFNSANFSSIATDANGVIQIFNVGAERMLGYSAEDVVDKITPAGISDPQEVIARAAALSQELDTLILPGFDALVFKASRGIEDIYELTYIRKDGSRFPAIVSVTALRDAQEKVIGYLLVGTDNTARKQVEAEQALLDQRLRDQQFYTRSLIESNIDAIMTTDPRGIISDVNQQMEALTGCTRDELIGAPFKSFFTDPERAETGIKQVLSEKKVSDYELTAQARAANITDMARRRLVFMIGFVKMVSGPGRTFDGP